MLNWHNACVAGKHYLLDTTSDFSDKVIAGLISVTACYISGLPLGIFFAIIFLVLDIVTGNCKALLNRTWISRKSFIGFFKIIIYIWAFLGTFLFDEAVGHILSTLPGEALAGYFPTIANILLDAGHIFKDYHIVTNFVAAFAIVTDFGSNLENLYEMGFPVPGALMTRLKIAQKKMDTE